MSNETILILSFPVIPNFYLRCLLWFYYSFNELILQQSLNNRNFGHHYLNVFTFFLETFYLFFLQMSPNQTKGLLVSLCNWLVIKRYSCHFAKCITSGWKYWLFQSVTAIVLMEWKSIAICHYFRIGYFLFFDKFRIAVQSFVTDLKIRKKNGESRNSLFRVSKYVATIFATWSEALFCCNITLSCIAVVYLSMHNSTH